MTVNSIGMFPHLMRIIPRAVRRFDGSLVGERPQYRVRRAGLDTLAQERRGEVAGPQGPSLTRKTKKDLPLRATCPWQAQTLAVGARPCLEIVSVPKYLGRVVAVRLKLPEQAAAQCDRPKTARECHYIDQIAQVRGRIISVGVDTQPLAIGTREWHIRGVMDGLRDLVHGMLVNSEVVRVAFHVI
ncbi:hypothetical protein B0T17DRAFT_505068 [Bombardia bombarda]|uniref:Uncharacterized protein n=1 Tax=Bombardia bombarda TaxID=252184 RepID=A0AA40C8R2_9PEZI|nr:hypothetical protein B0T17DRAFT_505068 [Bombardia bombarda]